MSWSGEKWERLFRIEILDYRQMNRFAVDGAGRNQIFIKNGRSQGERRNSKGGIWTWNKSFKLLQSCCRPFAYKHGLPTFFTMFAGEHWSWLKKNYTETPSLLGNKLETVEFGIAVQQSTLLHLQTGSPLAIGSGKLCRHGDDAKWSCNNHARIGTIM
jgi:hypothetical protein